MEDLNLKSINIQPKSYNKEDDSFEAVMTTEDPVERWNWNKGMYDEILLVDKKNVNKERFKDGGIPFLMDHTNSVEKVLGKVISVKYENGELIGKIQLSKSLTEDQKIVKDKIMDGSINKVSVGYRINKGEWSKKLIKKAEKQEDNEYKYVFKATDWTPFELSAVAIPADRKANIRSKDQDLSLIKKNDDNIKKENKIKPDKGVSKMEEKNQKPSIELVEKPNLIDEKKLKDESHKEGFTLAKNIASLLEKHGFKASDHDFKTEEEAKDFVLNEKLKADEKLNANTNGQSVNDGSVEGGRSEEDKQGELLQELVELKVGHEQFKKDLKDYSREARHYSGKRFIDFFNSREKRGSFRSDEEIAKSLMKPQKYGQRDFASPGDLPVVLDLTADKILNAVQEDLVDDSYKKLTRSVTLRDFKEDYVFDLTAMSDLKQVSQGDQYELGSIGESSEKVKVLKYGRKFLYTWESIINDDTRQFGERIRRFGDSAVRKNLELFYSSCFTSPSALSDGDAFFKDQGSVALSDVLDHNYVATANRYSSADDATALIPKMVKAEQLLKSQKRIQEGADRGATERFNFDIASVVCGVEAEAKVRRILKSDGLYAQKAGDQNPYAGKSLNKYSNTWLGDSEIWILGNSQSTYSPFIRATLAGQNEVTIRSKEMPDYDAYGYQVRLVVGYKPVARYNIVKLS